jgi:CubicO group peptidase (beta-lactamase class C family)
MHKGVDCGALAPDQAQRIDALFATVDRPDHPGAAVAVMSAGELVHLRCFGLASVEHEIPVTPDTVFRLGSLTKQLKIGRASCRERV